MKNKFEKIIKFILEKKVFIFYFICSFVLGYLVCYLSPRIVFDVLNTKTEDRAQTSYSFISPLLECDSGESVELSSFDEKIKNLSDELMSNGTINEISYYFRDLDNGIWIGINEDEKFAPASLMKLPLLMSYLKEIETDQSILSRSYVFTAEDENYEKQNIKPIEYMQLGNSYTVAELLFRMVAYSDNSALRMLLKNSGDFGMRVFVDLNMDIPADNEENFMSVRDYSRFFRILYNASYLNLNNSNSALEILSQSQFDEGIVSGVPGNVVVSHKFGEREINGEFQLHDCGIVYYPEKPYVLCVMTRGKDFDRLKSAISQISKETFESVDKNFK